MLGDGVPARGIAPDLKHIFGFNVSENVALVFCTISISLFNNIVEKALYLQ